ncbi:uncharacterized protein BDV14DRAFT_201356 [Aspergillus stella-maris]|uniref:uncharacterized protein n=1 Tax=Aspergillus stella-maris TaxID=1810926 RepID=UPI003CCD59E0
MQLIPVALLALAGLSVAQPMREATEVSQAFTNNMALDMVKENHPMVSTAATSEERVALSNDRRAIAAPHPMALEAKHPMANNGQMQRRQDIASSSVSVPIIATTSSSASVVASATPTPPAGYGDYGAYGEYANYGDYLPEVGDDA